MYLNKLSILFHCFVFCLPHHKELCELVADAMAVANRTC